MNIKVVYHSRTGNTKKIADTIASELNISAEPVSADLHLDKVDLLFIGDGVYAGKADSKTMNFIKALDVNKVKNAAVFGTYGGMDKAITSMKESLNNQGIHLVDESFACKGQAWLVANRNHPNAEDFTAAKDFAHNVVKQVEKV
jgi:flavodoxin